MKDSFTHETDDNAIERLLREYVRESMLMSSEVDRIDSYSLSTKQLLPDYEAPPHIFERDYVTNVLGIQLPLNESHPYSSSIHDKIIHEQRTLEEYFKVSDYELYEHYLLREQDEDGDEETDKWFGAAVKFAGDAKNFAKAMKVMATDPTKVGDFVGAVKETIIDEPLEKMKEFLSGLTEAIPKWGLTALEKLGEWAEKILGWIDAAVQKVSGMSGWKQAIAIAGLAVGMKFVWKEIKDVVIGGGEKLNDLSDAVEEAQEGDTNESFIYKMSLASAFHGQEHDDLLSEKNWEKEAQKIEDEEKKKEEEKKQSKEEKIEKKVKEKTAEEDKKVGRADKAEDLESGEKLGVAEEKTKEAEEMADELGVKSVTAKTFEKIKGLIKWVKENVYKKLIGAAKSYLKGMAADAVAGAVSGGVSSFFSALGALYGGAKFVLRTISAPLKSIVSKSEIEKEVEEEGGEEGFWGKIKGKLGGGKKKEKEAANEIFLRIYLNNIIKEELSIKRFDDEPGAGIVVVREFDGGRKVLCLHTKNFMDIPKGRIEPGEDVLSAALRETQEEVNITDLKFKWGLTAAKMGNMTIFVAETKQNPEISPNPHTGVLEHLGASWHTWDEAAASVKPWLSPGVEWARKVVELSQ